MQDPIIDRIYQRTGFKVLSWLLVLGVIVLAIPIFVFGGSLGGNARAILMTYGVPALLASVPFYTLVWLLMKTI